MSQYLDEKKRNTQLLFRINEEVYPFQYERSRGPPSTFLFGLRDYDFHWPMAFQFSTAVHDKRLRGQSLA